MTISLTFGEIFTIFCSFIVFAAGAGKLLLAQIDKRLEARFKAQDEAASQASSSLRDTLARFASEDTRMAADMARLAERVNHLDAAIKGSPSHDDMRRMTEKLSRQGETLSRLEGEMKGANDTLRLILGRFTEKGLP